MRILTDTRSGQPFVRLRRSAMGYLPNTNQVHYVDQKAGEV